MTTIRILFVVYVSFILSFADGNDAAYTGTSDSGQNVDIQKQHKDLHQDRLPRSPLGPGSKAFKRLMKDAFEVTTRSQFYKKFVKYGSEENAYHDFWGASPSMINDKAKTRAGDTVTDGYIGSLMMRFNPRDRTQHGRPTITLRTMNQKLNTKIVYMDSLKKTDQ